MGNKIQFSVGDYVVIKPEKKATVIFVTKKSGAKCTGQFAKFMPYTEHELVFMEENVIANLGEKPHSGNIYGESFDPYIKTVSTAIGECHLFRRLKKEEKETLISTVKKTYKRMKKYNLTSIFPVTLEVRDLPGKKLGYYKPSKNDEELDVICVKGKLELLHTLYHEYAHAVWNSLRDKEKAKWVLAYSNSIDLQYITPKISKGFLKDMECEYGVSVSDYRKTLEPDAKNTLKYILDYIKRTHRLSIKDLDILRQSGESLESFWPNTDIEIAEINLMVSEYAEKSALENYCECFANFMVERELPKNLQKLMVRTLKPN